MISCQRSDGLAMWPKSPTAPRYGVVFAHGSAKSATFCLERATGLTHLSRRLIDAGHYGFSGDNAGPNTWGNQASIDAFNGGPAKLVELGSASGKVAIVAASMGAAVALNWAARNPTKVACIVLIIPVINLSDIVSNNRNGWAYLINAAYGTWSETTKGAAYNPATQAIAGAFDDIPMLIFYGTSDTGCVPSQTEAFAANVGPSATLVPMPFGHENAAYLGVDHAAVEAFITAHTEA